MAVRLDEPTNKLPNWLMSSCFEAMAHEKSKLTDVLLDTVFYPSCAYDGALIKHLVRYFQSFIYVDHSFTTERLDYELKYEPFRGYDIFFDKYIPLDKLLKTKWAELTLEKRFKDQFDEKDGSRNKKFARWMIFQRDANLDDSHGPERFSVVFVRAEGITAFYNLYLKNVIKPSTVAIIQPGFGFGGNWSDFTDPTTLLPFLVMNNPAGAPQYLAFGGWGPKKYMDNTWNWFKILKGWYQYTDNGNVAVYSRL